VDSAARAVVAQAMTDEIPNNGGRLVPGWTPPPRPAREPLEGAYVRLEPLTASHAPGLFSAFEGAGHTWRFLPTAPFAGPEDCAAWVAGAEASEDPLFFAVRMLGTGDLGGFMSLLRIAPAAGSIEVGFINFAPVLQRTPAATEAVWLTIKWAFEAGYRRFEWKCDSLNLPSRRAAQRYGLSYEGIFRQALVVKGRNRDTAWFAAIDSEYPALRTAFETWLAPSNFDGDGRQILRLGDLTAPILAGRDPALSG